VHRQGVAALYGLHFSRELKDLKKALTLPEPLRTWADDFGGIRNVTNLILEKVKRDLFAVDIRTEEGFHSHARQVRDRILISGQDVIRAVEPLLKAYAITARDLRNLEIQNRQNSGPRAFLVQIRREMEELLPEDFLCRWSAERLKHTPRYLKALKIRADRGLLNREKDQRREQEIRPFVDRLMEISNNLPAYVSAEKSQALADFSLMVEEYKVSLFAQELKTAFPVSARRLEEKLSEIDRMF